MPGTFIICCTGTMNDNKYVGLVLKDSREKQQDRKREEVQGESRFVTKRAQQRIPHICHFFTQAKFLENKIYTEKRQFFALNL